MPIITTPEEKLLKKFEKIDSDWRQKVESSNVEQLKALLIEVTKLEAANQEAKAVDEDLASKKAEYDNAAAGYKEATSMNKLKIKFALRHLEANGG